MLPRTRFFLYLIKHCVLVKTLGHLSARTHTSFSFSRTPWYAWTSGGAAPWRARETATSRSHLWFLAIDPWYTSTCRYFHSFFFSRCTYPFHYCSSSCFAFFSIYTSCRACVCIAWYCFLNHSFVFLASCLIWLCTFQQCINLAQVLDLWTV